MDARGRNPASSASQLASWRPRRTGNEETVSRQFAVQSYRRTNCGDVRGDRSAARSTFAVARPLYGSAARLRLRGNCKRCGRGGGGRGGRGGQGGSGGGRGGQGGGGNRGGRGGGYGGGGGRDR